MTTDHRFDYVIVGAGTTGCVLASRLSQVGNRVALIEAGPIDYSDLVMLPLNAPKLHTSPLEYRYESTPQAELGGRSVVNFGGRLVSGSSGVNYGLWTRGAAVEYNNWASQVDDKRWSYEALLPYLKKIEQHYRPEDDPSVYGFEGYIRTLAGKRVYPLRDQVLRALLESGQVLNHHANGGDPIGVGAYTDIWHQGRRQPSGLVNDLSNVRVFTNCPVACILIDPSTKSATGAQLSGGPIFEATKEVILACGAIRTPQLLMLSGIGPSEHLATLSIKCLADLPVGRNLHDFPCITLYWRLRDHHSQTLAAGAPGWFDRKEFMDGMPIEWIVTSPAEREAFKAACAEDGVAYESREKRGDVEVFFAYAPLGSGGMGAGLPFDGSIISSVVVCLLPSSRGSITLRDTNPDSAPVLDPAYLSTQRDKTAMRTGMRIATKAMLETTTGKGIVAEEVPPQGSPTILGSQVHDNELNERLEKGTASLFHCAGTASMGLVVDTECRVKGVKALRVCDASILPVPLAGKYQYPMYAIAELVADMILGLV